MLAGPRVPGPIDGRHAGLPIELYGRESKRQFQIRRKIHPRPAAFVEMARGREYSKIHDWREIAAIWLVAAHRLIEPRVDVRVDADLANERDTVPEKALRLRRGICPPVHQQPPAHGRGRVIEMTGAPPLPDPVEEGNTQMQIRP